MRNKTATIYDVATEAGVSPATVSRVLNDPSLVNPDKRQKVLDAIRVLSFVPRAEAVAHARKQYKKIGVIAPFFTEPSFMQRLRGISGVLSAHHYELVMYTITDAVELEEYLSMLCASKRVDGLIVLCLNLSEKSLATLGASGIPVCFVEPDINGFDSVVVDNYRGGRLAAEAFWSQGYRIPSFIGETARDSFSVPAALARMNGFRDFFAEKSVIMKPEMIRLDQFPANLTGSGFLDGFGNGMRPDCIFVSSDMLAVRLARTFHPGTIIPAIIGFDDLDISGPLQISTISQNLDESGRIAAEMILDRLKDPAREIRKIHVPLKYIERGGSRK